MVDSTRSIEDNLITQVRLQAVGSVVYFDAAGFPGWTVGLKENPDHIEWRWPQLHGPRNLTISISPDE